MIIKRDVNCILYTNSFSFSKCLEGMYMCIYSMCLCCVRAHAFDLWDDDDNGRGWILHSWLPDPWNWNCHTLWPQPPDNQVICTPVARHHQHHHCPSVRWIVMSGAGHITNTISDISQRKYALPREGLILEVIYGHIILLITHKALLSAECIILRLKFIRTPATWWCIAAQHTVYHHCFKNLDNNAEPLQIKNCL